MSTVFACAHVSLCFLDDVTSGAHTDYIIEFQKNSQLTTVTSNAVEFQKKITTNHGNFKSSHCLACVLLVCCWYNVVRFARVHFIYHHLARQVYFKMKVNQTFCVQCYEFVNVFVQCIVVWFMFNESKCSKGNFFL